MSETFVKYFSRSVAKVRVVPKEESWLMRAIGSLLAFLTKLKIVDFPKAKFMNDYTTTLWGTIYSGHMTEDDPPSSLSCHELTHRLQFLVWYMPIMYLLSKEWRMYFESESVQAEILCFPDRKRDEEWMQGRVIQFGGYGIPEDIVRDHINTRMEEVEEDDPRDRPARVKAALTTWEAECAA